MGLFKKVKKTFKKAAHSATHPVATVKKLPAKVAAIPGKAIKNPARYTVGVLSGGTTELLRKAPVIGDVYRKAFDEVYAPIFNQVAAYETFGLSSAVQAQFTVPANIIEQEGDADMGVNLGALLGNVGTILTRTNQTNNPYVAGTGAILSAFTPAAKVPSAPSKSAPSLMAPTAVVGAAAVGGLTQEIVNFGSVLLGKLGIKIKSINGFSPALKRALGAIASFARRTPGGSMISILVGLGLTQYAASVLTAWFTQRRKHRRMNPANSKALRRAARRIKSFHRLCMHTDVIKSSSRRRSYGKRCNTCRVSPCSC